MAIYPYENFKEWEVDMDRMRQHPQDAHLIKHIRGRVKASSENIQRQVHEYLQNLVFESNPVPAGQQLAKKTNKVFFIRHPQDPWFHV